MLFLIQYASVEIQAVIGFSELLSVNGGKDVQKTRQHQEHCYLSGKHKHLEIILNKLHLISFEY